MFEVLRKSLATGIVTGPFPAVPNDAAARFARGRPEIDFANWKDARLGADACPTGALDAIDTQDRRKVVLDLAKCTFCGLCAEADPTIAMTHNCELAAKRRADLVTTTAYELNPDGTHKCLIEVA